MSTNKESLPLADLPPVQAAAEAQPTVPHRGIRSFVVRAGRMGTGQVRALEELAPLYTVPPGAAPLDFRSVFGNDAPVVLEIGFGMGQATAAIAANRPDHNFLGIEVHPPGVGALLLLIHEQGLGNLRIIQDDAVEVLAQRIPLGSLHGVHIFFPDPWHKKRHNKRRLIQPEFVRHLVRHIAPGGYVHCATDWQPYAEQMLEVLSAEPALENTVPAGGDTSGYAPRPDYRPLTKFEARGIRLGHGVWDLVFRRR